MKTVEISILGNKYQIKGDASEEYMQDLANFVDGKIREITGKSPNTTPARAAILAALNIADELFKSREGESSLSADIEKKADELIQLFE